MRSLHCILLLCMAGAAMARTDHRKKEEFHTVDLSSPSPSDSVAIKVEKLTHDYHHLIRQLEMVEKELMEAKAEQKKLSVYSSSANSSSSNAHVSSASNVTHQLPSKTTNVFTGCREMAEKANKTAGLRLDQRFIFALTADGEEQDKSAIAHHRDALTAAHEQGPHALGKAVVLYLASVVNVSEPRVLATLAGKLGNYMAKLPPCRLNLPQYPHVAEWFLCSNDAPLLTEELRSGAAMAAAWHRRHDRFPRIETAEQQQYADSGTAALKHNRQFGVVMIDLLYASIGNRALINLLLERMQIGHRQTTLFSEIVEMEREVAGAGAVEKSCNVRSRINTLTKQMPPHAVVAHFDLLRDTLNGMATSEKEEWSARYAESDEQQKERRYHFFDV